MGGQRPPMQDRPDEDFRWNTITVLPCRTFFIDNEISELTPDQHGMQTGDHAKRQRIDGGAAGHF